MTPGLNPLPNTTKEQVAQRAEAARRAQAIWRRYTLAERVRRLRAFWEEIRAARGRLVEVLRVETRKPVFEIESLELAPAEFALRYFTRNAHRILRDRPASKLWFFINKRAYVRYRPRGVVGVIAPWNLPFIVPFCDIVPTLIAGNAALVKPSESTPRSSLLMEDIARASGLFPEGLLQVLPGGAATGEAVVEESDFVLFTGSIESGRRVAQACAAGLKPAVLGLSGKRPMIVLKDAPIARAAKAAAWGRFVYSGQACGGVERVYVEEPMYAEFARALSVELEALRSNAQGSGEAGFGPLALPRQLSLALEHLEDARALGGKVVGGEILDPHRLLMAPALVLDARPEMRVMREETLAPILPVMAVRDEADAVRRANEGLPGLAASVWSRDLDKAETLGAHVESGVLEVNDLMTRRFFCSLPFGGRGEGLGRRFSDDGLRMFCDAQSVLVHEWPDFLPEWWWPPYSQAKERLLSWLARLS